MNTTRKLLLALAVLLLALAPAWALAAYNLGGRDRHAEHRNGHWPGLARSK